MSLTARYRVQHQEIDAVITRLTQLLVDVDTLRSHARDARSLVATLSGKVRVHLAMEDRSLYPDLLAHANPTVREKARRFQAEMGELGKAFFAYVARWPHHQAVAADPAAFGRETRDVLRALAARMLAEDTDLYPAAEGRQTVAVARR
jgi:hypothetical protein